VGDAGRATTSPVPQSHGARRAARQAGPGGGHSARGGGG
jgi:hypothetical protein